MAAELREPDSSFQEQNTNNDLSQGFEPETGSWADAMNQLEENRPADTCQSPNSLPIEESSEHVEEDRQDDRVREESRGRDRRLVLFQLDFQLPIDHFDESIYDILRSEDELNHTDHELMIKLLDRFVRGPFLQEERMRLISWMFKMKIFRELAEEVRNKSRSEKAEKYGQRACEIWNTKNEMAFNIYISDTIKKIIDKNSDAEEKIGTILNFLEIAGVISNDSSQEEIGQQSVEPVYRGTGFKYLRKRVGRVRETLANWYVQVDDIEEIVYIVDETLHCEISAVQCEEILTELMTIPAVVRYANSANFDGKQAYDAGCNCAETREKEGSSSYYKTFFKNLRYYNGKYGSYRTMFLRTWYYLEGIKSVEQRSDESEKTSDNVENN